MSSDPLLPEQLPDEQDAENPQRKWWRITISVCIIVGIAVFGIIMTQSGSDHAGYHLRGTHPTKWPDRFDTTKSANLVNFTYQPNITNLSTVSYHTIDAYLTNRTNSSNTTKSSDDKREMTCSTATFLFGLSIFFFVMVSCCVGSNINKNKAITTLLGCMICIALLCGVVASNHTRHRLC